MYTEKSEVKQRAMGAQSCEDHGVPWQKIRGGPLPKRVHLMATPSWYWKVESSLISMLI